MRAVPLPADLAKTPGVNLKWHLTFRVAAIGLLCFVLASLVAFGGTYRSVRQRNDDVADAVARQLDLQLFRIDTNIDVMSRFPDWDPVADIVMTAGQCIRYVDPAGSVGRASCVASQDAVMPTWFAGIGGAIATRAAARRPIAYHAKSYGTLFATTDKDAVLASIWQDLSGLLGLTTLLTISMCVLQHMAIGRALRPTKQILAGFERLVRGDLSCRLPAFRLAELHKISDVFNKLAAHLDAARRENAGLAAKLVEGQEQERLCLARDLHDELAQNLSAMSALAGSIKASAQDVCPALQTDAERLSQLAIGVLTSLRTTLHALRPPEIDDLGLAASLNALALEHERRADGRFRVLVDVDEDACALLPTTSSHVYRIVQEGLTNVAKHSDAKRVRVALERAGADDRAGGDGSLILTIGDDGRPVAEGAAAGGGLGHVGMRERVMALGGELVVGPLAERGYMLRAVLPMRREGV